MKKILLVEDDVAIADVYTTIIQAAGFEIEAVSYGSEALRKIKESVSKKEGIPDLVLLDLVLPDMYGGEVLKEIRQNEATKNMKVFILTNQQDPELESGSGGIKPDKFLIKANTGTAELVSYIKNVLT